MADLYASYAALAAAEVEGVSYERRSVPVTGATWCSIAIHGGGIEVGSGEAARAVAAGVIAHYEFAGLKSSNNVSLHVTSTNFDEPIGQALVTGSLRCLSFHGYTGTTGVAETSIGGLDTATADRIRTALKRAGFSVISAAQEINGSDPTNIANRTTLGVGVQLEMSRALRDSFFPNGDTTRTMRDSGQRTATFDRYVAAVRSAYEGRGIISLAALNTSRWATTPYSSPNIDIAASLGTDRLATGGPQFLNLTGRWVDSSNGYLARLAFNEDAAVSLTLRKRVAAVETLLATAPNTSNLTHAAGRMFRLRMQITGSTLRAKVWLAGAAEPSEWSVTATDTSFTAAGAVGVRAILSTTNTNALPVIAYADQFRQLAPQRMRVVRSVNGVTKAQQAGADVRLAYPSAIAL